MRDPAGKIHQVRVRDVETSHTNISVLDTERGEKALVLLHANSLCKEVFLPLIENFRGSCRIVAPDLPGHGRSGNAFDPRRSYSLPGYADCVAELLDRLGITRAAVVGWSLGGHVGFEMTRRYAGLSGLVAICAPPFDRLADGTLAGFLPNPRLGLSGARELSESEIDEFVTLVSDYRVPPDPFWRQSIARTDGRARQYMFEGVLEPGSGQRGLAEGCNVPLALVVGGNDQFVDRQYLASLNCPRLWHGTVQVIEGTGHAPHIHAPERFHPLLRTFLTNLA